MKITPQLKDYQQSNEEICSIFAERLNALRGEYKFTLPQIADILGISRQSVVYYTMGNRIPSIPILISLARLFETSVDYLLGLTDNRDVGGKG